MLCCNEHLECMTPATVQPYHPLRFHVLLLLRVYIFLPSGISECDSSYCVFLRYDLSSLSLRCLFGLRNLTPLQIVSDAIVSCSDTPHALPETGTFISIGRWILRLHLAHYCLMGRYPTLLHRFFKLRLDRKQHSRLADPPPTTHHLVGKLIFIQAAATLMQSLAHWYVSYRPPKRTAQLPPGNDESESQVETVTTPSSPTVPLCGICRMPRVESAASSTCGHVFCWKCLYEWVSTNRPECPLCRSPCRPQDIVAIYNYAPS